MQARSTPAARTFLSAVSGGSKYTAPSRPNTPANEMMSRRCGSQRVIGGSGFAEIAQRPGEEHHDHAEQHDRPQPWFELVKVDERATQRIDRVGHRIDADQHDQPF